MPTICISGNVKDESRYHRRRMPAGHGTFHEQVGMARSCITGRCWCVHISANQLHDKKNKMGKKKPWSNRGTPSAQQLKVK